MAPDGMYGIVESCLWTGLITVCRILFTVLAITFSYGIGLFGLRRFFAHPKADDEIWMRMFQLK